MVGGCRIFCPTQHAESYRRCYNPRKSRGIFVIHEKKLDTNSLIEAELVGIDHMMPQILWMRYFLESRGFTVSDNFVYQYNQSNTKLDNNGQYSSSCQRRNINIGYFLLLTV